MTKLNIKTTLEYLIKLIDDDMGKPKLEVDDRKILLEDMENNNPSAFVTPPLSKGIEDMNTNAVISEDGRYYTLLNTNKSPITTYIQYDMLEDRLLSYIEHIPPLHMGILKEATYEDNLRIFQKLYDKKLFWDSRKEKLFSIPFKQGDVLSSEDGDVVIFDSVVTSTLGGGLMILARTRMDSHNIEIFSEPKFSNESISLYNKASEKETIHIIDLLVREGHYSKFYDHPDARNTLDVRIGDLVIAWDNSNDAIIGTLTEIHDTKDYKYTVGNSALYRFCEKFESMEQYNKINKIT